MKCIVLGAGYATRLYPLTENFPKPLLKIKDKTILDHLVDDISTNCSISSFVIISNHKYIEHYKEWKSSKALDISLIDDGTVTNETRLGAVKDILLAIEELKIDEDVLIIAGDNVLDFSFSSFIKFFNEKKHSCIMKYYEKELKEGKRYCVVEADKDDKVIYMKEKVLNPTSHFLVPPFYIYRKEDLPLIKKALDDGCQYDAPGSLVEWMSQRVDFYSYTMPGSRYDVGDIEGYRKICEEYKGIIYLENKAEIISFK